VKRVGTGTFLSVLEFESVRRHCKVRKRRKRVSSYCCFERNRLFDGDRQRAQRANAPTEFAVKGCVPACVHHENGKMRTNEMHAKNVQKASTHALHAAD
jgi:hypothetical protein